MLKKHNKFIVIAWLLVGALLLAACRGGVRNGSPYPAAGGDAERGFRLISTPQRVRDRGRGAGAAQQLGQHIIQSLRAGGGGARSGRQSGKSRGRDRPSGDREVLEASLANVQQAHVAAELELTDANLALLEAQKAYDDLFENWPELAIQAEQTLTDARQAARDASRNLSIKSTTADQLDIDIAYTQVVLSEKALEDAKEDFEPYANRSEDNLRARHLPVQAGRGAKGLRPGSDAL